MKNMENIEMYGNAGENKEHTNFGGMRKTFARMLDSRPQKKGFREQQSGLRVGGGRPAIFGWRASDLGLAPNPKSVAAFRNRSLTATSSF